MDNINFNNVEKNLINDTRISEIKKITKDGRIHYDKILFNNKIKKLEKIHTETTKIGFVDVFRENDNTFYVSMNINHPTLKFAGLIVDKEMYDDLKGKLKEIMQKLLVTLTIALTCTYSILNIDSLKNLTLSQSYAPTIPVLTWEDRFYTEEYKKDYGTLSEKAIDREINYGDTVSAYVFENKMKEEGIILPTFKEIVQNRYGKDNFYSIEDLSELRIFYLSNEIGNDIYSKEYKKVKSLLDERGASFYTQYNAYELFEIFGYLEKEGFYVGSSIKLQKNLEVLSSFPKSFINEIINQDVYKEKLSHYVASSSYEIKHGFGLYFNGYSLLDKSNSTIAGFRAPHFIDSEINLKYETDFLKVRNKYEDYKNRIIEADKTGTFNKTQEFDFHSKFSVGIGNNFNLPIDTILDEMERSKKDNKLLYNLLVNFYGTDKRLLLSTIDLNSNIPGIEQKRVGQYMNVFNLSRNDFLKSLKLGHNVNLEKYLKNIYGNSSLNEKVIPYINDDLSKNHFSQIVETEVIDRPYSNAFAHELSHIIVDNNNDSGIKNDKLSLSEYYKNLDLLNSSTSSINNKFYDDFYHRLLVKKMDQKENINVLGFGTYAFKQTNNINGVGVEVLPDLFANFFISPSYIAYLYKNSNDVFLKEGVDHMIEILDQQKIFSKNDFDILLKQKIKSN